MADPFLFTWKPVDCDIIFLTLPESLSPQNSVMEAERSDKIRLGMPYTLLVTTKDKHNNEVSQKGLEAKFLLKSRNTTMNCRVEHLKGSKYKITFTPLYPGPQTVRMYPNFSIVTHQIATFTKIRSSN